MKNNLPDNEDNKKAYKILNDYYEKNNGSQSNMSEMNNEMLKNALLEYANECDSNNTKTMEDGSIIMSIMWLWCQINGYSNDDAKNIQEFLSTYLPASFLYGGFSTVVQKMCMDFEI